MLELESDLAKASSGSVPRDTNDCTNDTLQGHSPEKLMSYAVAQKPGKENLFAIG